MCVQKKDKQIIASSAQTDPKALTPLYTSVNVLSELIQTFSIYRHKESTDRKNDADTDGGQSGDCAVNTNTCTATARKKKSDLNNPSRKPEKTHLSKVFPLNDQLKKKQKATLSICNNRGAL